MYAKVHYTQFVFSFYTACGCGRSHGKFYDIQGSFWDINKQLYIHGYKDTITPRWKNFIWRARGRLKHIRAICYNGTFRAGNCSRLTQMFNFFFPCFKKYGNNTKFVNVFNTVRKGKKSLIYILQHHKFQLYFIRLKITQHKVKVSL